MPKLGHTQHVNIRWLRGEEAICPGCGHHNAMLNTGVIGNCSLYECRDCHLIAGVADGSLTRTGSYGDWPWSERDGRIIARSLGKQCTKCQSFDMKELSFADRAERAQDLRIEQWQVPTHACNECGFATRY
jgi:predicted nucleic-acid-binding Zn-ribbon protein